MWTHYTANYMGYVMQFDDIEVDINQRDFKQYALTRVIYLKNPPRIDKKLPFAHQYFVSAKFKHWEYEKEWRISTDLRTSSREMNFVPECVSAIYIGHKIPDSKPGIYKMLLKIQEMIYPNASVYVVYPSKDLCLRPNG